MYLNLTEMSMALGAECAAVFGNVTVKDGEFAIGTARLSSKSDEITYVTASFWNFVATDLNGDDSIYFLVFGPDGDGTIDKPDLEDWPPANSGESNFLSGYWLELQVTSGPAKTTSCHRLRITLDWKIEVTKE